MEPTSSGTAAGIAGWKLIGGLAGLGALGAGLAALVVMCMTPPRTGKEWVVGLITTVVGSVCGGSVFVRYFDIGHWAQDVFGLMSIIGLAFTCGLPAWAVVRWVFNAIRSREGQGIDQVVQDIRGLRDKV